MHQDDTISHFRIEAEIGRGGMAIVYRALDQTLERTVALKVLPEQFTFDKGFIERFEREARTAANLRHPNIITIHSVGSEGDKHFFAMDFIDGRSVGEILKEHGRFTIPAAVKVTSDVLRALDYAHKQGVVHRDIKPDNILIDEHNQAIVTDFGIARAASGSRMTATGMSIGTPHYMSPEQARGKDVDARSDIYSLGIVLYEILTGKVPFDAEDSLAIAYSHVNDEPPDPAAGNADISEPLKSVVLKALAKDPVDRYQSAGEMLSAMKAAVSQAASGIREAVKTPPPQPAVEKKVQPEPRKTVVVKPSQPKAPPPKKSGAGLWVGLAVMVLALGGGGYWFISNQKPTPVASGGGGSVVVEAPSQTDATTPGTGNPFSETTPGPAVSSTPKPEVKQVSVPATVTKSAPKSSSALAEAYAHLEKVRSVRQKIAGLDDWEKRQGERIAKEKGADPSPKGEFETTAQYNKRMSEAKSAQAAGEREAAQLRKFREKELKAELASLESREFTVTARGTPGTYNADRKRLPVSVSVESLEGEFIVPVGIEAARDLKSGWGGVKASAGVAVIGDGLSVTTVDLSKDGQSWSSRALGWDGGRWITEGAAYNRARKVDSGTDISAAIKAWEGYLSAFSGGEHSVESERSLGVWKDRLSKGLVAFRGGWVTPQEKASVLAEEARKAEEARIAKLSGEFVRVPGGTFEMGDVFGDGYASEKPVHRVTVSSFWIGRYEVTQGQWVAVMGNNPSYFKGDDLPVERVSWDDVQLFIRKLNSLTGRTFRLPTEAEWEYAARSGGKRERYSGSDNVDSVAWYDGNSGKRTHPVGTKSPNGLGIYDMSGNVWEWCSDRYGKDYYSKSPSADPSGPSGGSYRVSRGGGWYYGAGHTRVAVRDFVSPGGRGSYLGFRLARTN